MSREQSFAHVNDMLSPAVLGLRFRFGLEGAGALIHGVQLLSITPALSQSKAKGFRTRSRTRFRGPEGRAEGDPNVHEGSKEGGEREPSVLEGSKEGGKGERG